MLMGVSHNMQSQTSRIMGLIVALIVASSLFVNAYGQDEATAVLEDEDLLLREDNERRELLVEVMMIESVRVCWPGIVDMPDPERLSVKLRVQLDIDGMLKDEIELIEPSQVPLGDHFMARAIDRALRAVRACQPYRLPVDDYETWEELVLNFRHDG